MTVLTAENVQLGLKVVRGPGWMYDNQGEESEYGVVTGLRYNDDQRVYVADVKWIGNAPERSNGTRVIHNNSYAILDRTFTRLTEFLALFEEKVDKSVTEGELVPQQGHSFEETWNNAIEFCIDVLADLPSNTTPAELAEILYNKRLEVKQNETERTNQPELFGDNS